MLKQMAKKSLKTNEAAACCPDHWADNYRVEELADVRFLKVYCDILQLFTIFEIPPRRVMNVFKILCIIFCSGGFHSNLRSAGWVRSLVVMASNWCILWPNWPLSKPGVILILYLVSVWAGIGLCGIILICLSAERPQTTGFQLNGAFSSCVSLETDKLYHHSGHQYKGCAAFFSYAGFEHFSLGRFRCTFHLRMLLVESSGIFEDN